MFHAFDPVSVRLSIDSKNIQHEKFVLQLVEPYVEGFSVPPLVDVEMTEVEVPQKKRKK